MHHTHNTIEEDTCVLQQVCEHEHNNISSNHMTVMRNSLQCQWLPLYLGIHICVNGAPVCPICNSNGSKSHSPNINIRTDAPLTPYIITITFYQVYIH